MLCTNSLLAEVSWVEQGPTFPFLVWQKLVATLQHPHQIILVGWVGSWSSISHPEEHGSTWIPHHVSVIAVHWWAEPPPLTGINEADKVVQVESSKHFILPHSPPHVSWAHWGPKPPLPFFSNKVLLVSPLLILYLVAAWPESERNLYSYLDTIRQCDLWCLIFKGKESVEQTRELSVFSSNMKWGSVSQCFSIAGWYCGPPGPHVTPQ